MRPHIDPTVSFYGEPEPSLWARIVPTWLDRLLAVLGVRS